MTQLVEEGLNVTCSTPGWRKGSCGDLCGIEECGQQIVEDVRQSTYVVEEWTAVMGVAETQEDVPPSMATVSWGWPLSIWPYDLLWAKEPRVAMQ
jgi:hypothetical protein